MAIPLVIDALNGSLIDEEYVEEALKIGKFVFHITVNNFRKVVPYPSLEEALTDLSLCRRWLGTMAKKVILIRETSDIDRAMKSEKVGIILGFQNMPEGIRSTEILSVFYTLGVRIIQITHNERNLIGDGCSEVANAGLSNLGRKFVKEMNRLGILIDLSHVGEATCMDTLEISSHPVAITHANAAAVRPSARNKSNAVLDALKRNGGVIGITFFPPVVNRKPLNADIDDVVAQFDYIAERIGTNYIGIGSDFITGQPRERYDALLRQSHIYGKWPWQFPIPGLQGLENLFSLLLKRGYSGDDIDRIAWRNFRRVFEQVWFLGAKDAGAMMEEEHEGKR